MSEMQRWNTLSPEAAERVLRTFCPSVDWARDVIRNRPFTDARELIDEARLSWLALDDSAWSGVLAAHDRIADVDPGAISAESAREQRLIHDGDPAARDQLSALASEYEAHFGFMFITAAYGRSTADIVRELVERRANSRSVEFSYAILQHQLIAQRRITEYFADS